MTDKLRGILELAWWKVDAVTELGREFMPTSKQHKNLLGDKGKYLDATIVAMKEPTEIEGKMYQLKYVPVEWELPKTRLEEMAEFPKYRQELLKAINSQIKEIDG